MQLLHRQHMPRFAVIVLAALTPGVAVADDALTQAKLFPADRVLEVKIELAEDDWDEIRRQTRNFFEALHADRQFEPIPGPYTYVNADVTIDGHRFTDVGIRKKGFIGSQSETRPSLKIKLNHQSKEGEIDGLTNLTLNNNKQDPTLVNQFMGYALFNAAGSPAPRCALASVTVNGQHLGVYSHVESMRRPLADREFGTDQGVLYEGTVVDFHAGWEGSFERKFGDDDDGRRKIEQLIDALQVDQEGDDEDDVEPTIGKLVDLEAFYRFWTVEGLLGSWDGYSGNRNNFHVYLHPETGKFHFLPWGADALFHKYSKIAYQPLAPVSVKTTGRVAYKLYQTESGRARYRRGLQQLLATIWNEQALLAETDRIEEMIQPYLGATQSEHSREIEKVREFIRARRADLLAELSGGMPKWDRVPEPPPVIPGSIAAKQDNDSIWNASKQGEVQEIEKWLADGVDVNARNSDGSTPISMAVLAGQTAAVKLLIEAGANVDSQTNEGHSSLHGAAFFGQLPAAQLLIEAGADVNLRNDTNETPLDVATVEWTNEAKGIVEFIARLVQVKIDVADVKAARPRLARLLLAHGGKSADELPQLAGKDIWEAAKLGDLVALKQFLTEEEHLDGHDDKGITPLCWAAMAGQTDAMEILIAAGADVNSHNRDGGTALHAAAFLGHRDAVEWLIDHNIKINVKNGRGETPLGTVAAEWDPQMQGITQFIARMLKLKLDIAEVKAARPEIAKLLRQNGGKTDVKTDVE